MACENYIDWYLLSFTIRKKLSSNHESYKNNNNHLPGESKKVSVVP